jgi:hypothetical protein
MSARNRRERRIADQVACDRSEVTDERAAEPRRKAHVSESRITGIEALLRPFSHCASLLLLP